MSETVADGNIGETVAVGNVHTPLGSFGAVFSQAGLCFLAFASAGDGACETWVQRHMPNARPVEDPARMAALAEQLTAYADGALPSFDVQLDLRGTEFQRAVWQAVCAVERGQTRTYAQIAEAIGRPRAVRAVGAANGANPVPIIVPCHRLVGSDGTLTGYGGGLDLKAHLLRLEGALG